MAITIDGAKISQITLSPDKETSKEKIQGTYQLVSNIGTVVASQSFNGYSLEVQFSRQTLEAFNTFVLSVKQDVELVLGLREGVKTT